MSKQERPLRFGPGIWATIRATGEHVKIDCWSRNTSEYRARSPKHGFVYPKDDELDEILVHPEAHLGRQWSRCRAPGCGAPLTSDLAICSRCQAFICTCGRCGCGRSVTATARTKAAGKKAALTAR